MKEKSLAKQLDNEKERAHYYEVLVGKIQTALFESKDPLEEVASIVLAPWEFCAWKEKDNG